MDERTQQNQMLDIMEILLPNFKIVLLEFSALLPYIVTFIVLIIVGIYLLKSKPLPGINLLKISVLGTLALSLIIFAIEITPKNGELLESEWIDYSYYVIEFVSGVLMLVGVVGLLKLIKHVNAK